MAQPKLQGFNELKFLASHMKHQGEFNPCEDALWDHLDAREKRSKPRSETLATMVAEEAPKGTTARVLTSKGDYKTIKVTVKRKILIKELLK